jgi:SAM-dependent methyltransferase
MLHHERDRASAFGDDAAQYDRARPSYPPELVDRLMADHPHEVLDVGCGTGIAARLFIDRGAHVFGVEEDARMAAVARESGLDVEISPFESWQPHGRTFDLLISGQAWHWIDPDLGAAKAAEALRSGGRIGLFWNVGMQDPAAVEAIDAAYRAHAPNLEKTSIVTGFFGIDRLSGPGRALEATGAFSDVETASYVWQHRYSRDAWLELLPTHSDHRLLPPEQLDALAAAIGDVIDAVGGHIDVTYETKLLTARRV